MKKSRRTDTANRTSDSAGGSLYGKSVLFMRISFGKSVLFSLELKPDMIRNSFRSVFLNTLLEKALRKQAVKDLLRHTYRRVGYFSLGLELGTYRN